MPKYALTTWFVCSLLGFAGCAAPRQMVNDAQHFRASDRAEPSRRRTTETHVVSGRKDHVRRLNSVATLPTAERPTAIAAQTKLPPQHSVSAPASVAPQSVDSTLTGVVLLPIEDFPLTRSSIPADSQIKLTSTSEPPAVLPVSVEPIPVPEESAIVEGTRLDLATALSMIGGDHPAVGFAQWRVQEAYAQLERAEALWLPSLQAGFSYHLHNGILQNVQGNPLNVNSSSFQSGFGAGAVAAGTNSRPGLVAQFHVSDAIFQPKIVERDAWARQFRANATYNDQLLEAALAYLELLSAEQAVQIIHETDKNTGALAKLTADYANAGQGLQSDADRLATELILVQSRLLRAKERSEVASARLAQALSADANQRYLPGEVTVLPIDLVASDYARDSLIATGLSHRPELSESQNLVSSACEAYKRQKYSPFVPSVLLGMSQSSFGASTGSSPGSMDDRMDFDAVVMWEVRNLGFGERAARNETNARIEQAKFEQVRTMDRVAREISEAHTQVEHRRQRIEITQQAILSAESSYARNLRRIQDGQGLPIEALQSIQALEQARQAYLDAVIEYNQAQFRLQWSLGWPVSVAGN